MEQTLLEIGKQVPSLAVLAGVVWLFLKAAAVNLDSHTAAIKAMQESFLHSLRDIQAQNIEARAQSREAIVDNTSAMNEMNKTLMQLLIVTRNGNGK